MILHAQSRAIISSLPSDASAITLTRLDLEKMVGDDDGTVVVLYGYKLNDRDWRITRLALRDYLTDQANRSGQQALQASDGDITEWRRHQRA